jgi:hypothetical protein
MNCLDAARGGPVSLTQLRRPSQFGVGALGGGIPVRAGFLNFSARQQKPGEREMSLIEPRFSS